MSISHPGFFGGFLPPARLGLMGDARCVPQAVDTVGEILLSLSYLPTAERLTVVVVKAKNLVWTNGKVTAGEQGMAGGHRGPLGFSRLEVGFHPGLSSSTLHGFYWRGSH